MMKSLTSNSISFTGIRLAEYAVTFAVGLVSLLGALRFLGLMR
jgi:hypothetical protein